MNGNLTVKSQREWINEKETRKTLSKKEAERRYADYLSSVAVGGPNYKTKRNNYREGNNGGSKQRGRPGGLKKTLGGISECTRDYALAIMNPWEVPHPPCIPDVIVMQSYKFSSQAKGMFHCGAQGTGFVTINIDGAIANGPVTGPYGVLGAKSPAGCCSNTNYNYPTFAVSNTLINPTEVDFIYSDSPIAYENLYRLAPPGSSPDYSNVNGCTYRLVGAGVKIRFLGAEFSRSGRVIVYREPNNKDCTGRIAMSGNDLLRDKETATAVNDREWHHAAYRPTSPDDMNYRGYLFFDTTQGGAHLVKGGVFGCCPLLIWVEGAEPNVAYEYDAIWHWEVIGPLLPAKSDSHSDPLGMSAVSQAIKQHQPTKDPASDAHSLINTAISIGKTAFSFVSDHLGGFGNIIPMAAAMIM